MPVVDEEQDRSIAWEGVIHEEVTGLVMVARGSNQGRRTTHTSSWELKEPAPHTSPPAGSSPSTSHLYRNPGRGGASDTAVFNSAVEGCRGGVLPGLVTRVSGVSFASQELLDADGVPEETGDGTAVDGDDTVAAADWLDVSRAMLGACDENGSAL